MDAVLALALLSLGMFVGVCVTALVYISAIRPGLLESADIETLHIKSVVSEDSAGGEKQIDQLTEVHDTLQKLISALDTTAQEHQLTQLSRRIEEHLNMQSRQLDDMTLQLNAELHSQDAALSGIITQLDSQTSIISNAHAILKDLQSSNDLAALAGRFTDLSEQVNSLADTLMSQDEQVREIHAKVAQGDEPLFTMMGKQGIQLNDLAAKLQAFDEKLGLVNRQAGAPELGNLNQEFEGYTTAIAELKSQITEQESKIATVLEDFASDRSLNAITSALRDQAQQIGKLDARLDEQSDILTQNIQTAGEHRGLLEVISHQLGELVPDIDAISKRKTRVIRQPNRLRDIKGIGPVYAGLLHEAGVQTYQQLAALTPEQLRGLVDVPRWRTINAESWIEQAKEIVALQEKLEADN